MNRPIYIIEVQPLPSQPPGVEFLRRVLKAMLRRYGYRCVDVREKAPMKEGTYSNEPVVIPMKRCTD